MLKKSQKALMHLFSIVTILVGIFACIPFRVFVSGTAVEVFNKETIVKFIILPVIVILLTLYINLKKYKQINKDDERSKVLNIFSYLPIFVLIAGLSILLLHTLTFEYYPMKDVAQSVLLVFATVAFVASLCVLPLVSKLTVKLNKKENLILDVVVFASLVVVVLLTWKVLGEYAKCNYDGYVYGSSNTDPYLFVLFVGLFFALIFGLKKLFRLVKENETLIYARVLDEKALSNVIKNQYDLAYNDILDDFENYFENEEIDESEEEIVNNIDNVNDVNEEVVNEQPVKVAPIVNAASQQDNIVDTVDSVNNDAIDDLHELNQLLVETDNKNDERMQEQAENIKKQIEVEKSALALDRQALEEYRAQTMAEIQALQAQVDEINDANEEVVVEAKPVKQKVFKPTFEQVLAFAMSLQEESWKITNKINEETGTGTVKFVKGKINFLTLQNTTSDYRITFMATEKKWSTILTTVKGVTIPKNANNNKLLKFVNKGISETAVIKSFIRESVKGVNEEIARIEKEKAEEKLRKAEAKKLAKAEAKKAAEENNN